MATVAVDAARAAVGDLAARHVVIVGAGDTSEQTARAFHAHGVTTMFVANRHRDRAIALAQRFGGASGSFDALPGELERADVVVSSTASPHAIIGAEELDAVMDARERRPLLLVDLAVPRDIDPACAALDGVTLMDMDALQRARARQPDRAADRGAARRGHRRGGDPDVRGLARPARGAADADRAARVRRRRSPTGCWRRTPAAGSPSATPSASKRWPARSSSACCTSPPSTSADLDAEHRHARLQLLRELFGLEEAEAEPGKSADVRRLHG